MGKLNILPPNPEEEKKGRFPSWLHRRLHPGGELFKTGDIVQKYRLNTVCEEAKCPNRFECYNKKTATFLALGKHCTRNCGFCDIDFSRNPLPPEEDEPYRIAMSVKELGLKHVVITMVARDDLEDEGASHIAKIIQTVREHNQCTVEVLTSDFSGREDLLAIVLKEKPEIFNHNIETVRRISPKIRHTAEYSRSLKVLSIAKSYSTPPLVKSGLMLGLGETSQEVEETLIDLKKAGCDIVTLGQYLQASRKKLLVKEFITPEKFNEYEFFGKKIGLSHVYAGPFIRSSYNADLFVH